MGRIPTNAEHFEWNGLHFEVLNMDGSRVDKVAVIRIKTDGIVAKKNKV